MHETCTPALNLFSYTQDRPRGRKKAGRSSTARQLSALFSESERESSSGAW